MSVSGIRRIDRYTITINGKRVRADEDQERNIRAMNEVQLELFMRVMGLIS